MIKMKIQEMKYLFLLLLVSCGDTKITHEEIKECKVVSHRASYCKISVGYREYCYLSAGKWSESIDCRLYYDIPRRRRR